MNARKSRTKRGSPVPPAIKRTREPLVQDLGAAGAEKSLGLAETRHCLQARSYCLSLIGCSRRVMGHDPKAGGLGQKCLSLVTAKC